MFMFPFHVSLPGESKVGSHEKRTTLGEIKVKVSYVCDHDPDRYAGQDRGEVVVGDDDGEGGMGGGGEEEEEEEAEEMTAEDREKKLAEEEERMQKLQDLVVPVGIYQVQVNIIEVRDLPEKDDNGMCDPIVYVKTLGAKMHTGVRKGQKSCVFDEMLYFKSKKEMDREDLMSGDLRIDVYDADTFSRNDLIGYFEVDLMSIYYNDHHEMFRQWVALQNGQSDNLGELCGYVNRFIRGVNGLFRE
jgi:hypothetical protein